MEPKDFIKNIVSDIRVDVSEEFDRNFERKGFFSQKWSETKLQNRRGSLLARSGKLRRSIMSPKQDPNSVTWSSSLPYAKIQNDGGEITVTEKMKRFFWAMYYKSAGAAGKGNSERSKRLNAEAQQWKNLALMKTGQKLKIEKRQFIGDHPVVRHRIEDIVALNMKELEKYFYNQLKQK